jgi:hypothetical protein
MIHRVVALWFLGLLSYLTRRSARQRCRARCIKRSGRVSGFKDKSCSHLEDVLGLFHLNGTTDRNVIDANAAEHPLCDD